MKPYIAFFKMSLMRNLQYRTAALAGIFTQFFFGFVFIMIFQAFYAYSSVSPDYNIRQLTQVIWLQQSFLMFIMLWFRDTEIFQQIMSGQIAYEMVRPTDLYLFWSSKLMGQRLAGGLLRCLPILFIAFLLPQEYRLTLPSNSLIFLLFVLSLILALVLIITISMLIYISVFYTLSPTGSFLIVSVFGEFLGGSSIPVPLMPDWLKTIAYLLPFRYISDLPFRIYVGHIKYKEAYLSIGMQIIWIILLGTFGYQWMKQALKRIIIQGG